MAGHALGNYYCEDTKEDRYVTRFKHVVCHFADYSSKIEEENKYFKIVDEMFQNVNIT